MNYQILSPAGEVLNTIVADADFMAVQYPGGNYREVPDAPAPVAIPQSITRAQAKLALLSVGLLDDVQPAINAIADPVQRAAAQIEWDDRLTFERSNPTLNALASAMGMNREQLDALFIQAVTL